MICSTSQCKFTKDWVFAWGLFIIENIDKFANACNIFQITSCYTDSLKLRIGIKKMILAE